MDKKYESSLSVRQISRLLKKMTIHDGDVVLVRQSKFNADEVLEMLRKGIQRLDIGAVYVIVVSDFEDISSLNQQEMNAHGWWHINQINKVSRIPPRKKSG